jgi:hypothetical protein
MDRFRIFAAQSVSLPMLSIRQFDARTELCLLDYLIFYPTVPFLTSKQLHFFGSIHLFDYCALQTDKQMPRSGRRGVLPPPRELLSCCRHEEAIWGKLSRLIGHGIGV